MIALKDEEVIRIMEALVLAEYYTGDLKYKNVLEKLQLMQKEWKREQVKRLKF